MTIEVQHLLKLAENIMITKNKKIQIRIVPRKQPGLPLDNPYLTQFLLKLAVPRRGRFPAAFMSASPLASMWAPFMTMVWGMLGIGLQLQLDPVMGYSC